MHQVSTKTPMGPPGSPGSSRPSGSAKLPGPPEKSPRTPTGQILNEINDPNSKYFESPQTPTPTPANTTGTARIFSENLIQILATNEFDQSIEKIDFIPKKFYFAAEKSANFSSNIAVKNSKQTTRKRKAD